MKPGVNGSAATSAAAAPTPAQQPLHQSAPPRDARAALVNSRTVEQAAPWFAQPVNTAVSASATGGQASSRANSEPAFAREPGFATQAQNAPRTAKAGNSYSEWHDEVRDLRSALDEARSMLASFSAQGRAGAEVDARARRLRGQRAAALARHRSDAGGADGPRRARARHRPRPKLILTAVRAPSWAAASPPIARPGCAAAVTRSPSSGHRCGQDHHARQGGRARPDGRQPPRGIDYRRYLSHRRQRAARPLRRDAMGVPAFVAKSARELVSAIERCSRCDLILIDTAGRSAPLSCAPDSAGARGSRGGVAPGRQRRQRPARSPPSPSATRPSRPDRLVITKVDEAVAPGALLSAAAGLGVPVSACVCDGQRVPEDIHAVTRNELVDLVLGSSHS